MAVVLAVLAVAMVCCSFSEAHAARHRVMRGLVDDTWVKAQGTERTKIVRELSRQLHAQVVRIAVSWASAEPTQGQYNAAYLENVRAAAAEARAAGLRVLVIVCYTPRWASDRRFWHDPPFSSVKKGVYQSYYPVDPAALPAWEAFTRHLATTLKGTVWGYECWCEPNLWCYLWPQKTPDDPYFAVHRYAALLKPFYRAVNAVDRKALVLGGVTAPVGTNDRHRTSPRRFATRLAKEGLLRFMDGYSHHPYQPGPGRPMLAPEARPRFPKYTITLGNIGALLRAVPREPIYLTEYGYTTHDSSYFGGARVSERTQAAYLKRAYRRADRYPRIKVLLWFQRRDVSPSGKVTDANGLYFGLRRLNATRKPSWYAFARLRKR